MTLGVARVVGPCFDLLLDSVRNSRETIRIASPFVKEGVARDLVQAKPSNVRLEYLNSFKLKYFYSGSSDLSAIETLFQIGGEVRSLHSLHAKLYVFDATQALVTSANLTHRGLTKNYEYGLLVSEPNLIKDIIGDFDSVFTSDDQTNKITEQEIIQARKILESAPKRVAVEFPAFNAGPDIADEFSGGSAPIEAGLSGWKLDVFKCLVRIGKKEFRLDEVYGFESELRTAHPNNRYVKDKIRQQLQNLRDVGIIEFVGNGLYRKLW